MKSWNKPQHDLLKAAKHTNPDPVLLASASETESEKITVKPRSRVKNKTTKSTKVFSPTVRDSKCITSPPENWESDKRPDDSDRQQTLLFLSLLVAWGRERGLYMVGLSCLMMCAVVFTLQAYMAYRSYQMLHQITTRRHIPETLYQIYFEGHDWALNLDKVDMRANTTLFIH